MRQFLQLRYIFFIIIGVLGISVSGCDKDMHVSLGNSNEELGVNIMDSMTVYTSTYQMKNIPTANTGALLVGKVTHPETGSVKSSSYFRLAFTSFTDDIPQDATFDSLTLVVRPNAAKYYYGDTTKVQTLSVHRVTQTINLKTLGAGPDGNDVPVFVTASTLFSDQKFNYDAASLGDITFQPRIRSIDTLSIRLQDVLGQEIFGMLKSKDTRVTSNENFQEYFKGLVIVPDEQNTTMLALNDTVRFDINYSYTGADGFVKKGMKTITTGARNYQYNNLEADRSGTAFAALSATSPELKSSLTGGVTYLQAGTGVVAKLNIPSLNQFMNEPNIAVNKAELIIETTGDNYGATPVPPSLLLFIADYTGRPYSFVRLPAATTFQQAGLVPGDGLSRNGRYVFNMIDYIKNVNNAEHIGSSLFLSVASPNLFSTSSTAVLATQNNQPKIKLNIVYTKFK